MKKAYTFYASLQDFSPTIWRTFSIDGDCTLSELVYTVMTLFEMQANHLFKVQVPTGQILIEEVQQKQGTSFDKKAFNLKHPDLHKVRHHYELLQIYNDYPQIEHLYIADVTQEKILDALDLHINRCTIWYDFGDDWNVELQVQSIEETNHKSRTTLLGGEGYGIIEDCGGAYGLTKYDLPDFNINEKKTRLDILPKLFKRIYEENYELTEKELRFLTREQ